MASFVPGHVFRCLPNTRDCLFVCTKRTFYSSSPVHKKKPSVIIEDLFASEEPAPQLLASDEIQPSSTTPTPPQAPTNNGRRKKALSPGSRLARFNELYDYVAPRVSKIPRIYTSQPRKTVWLNLFGLATSEEQLTKVVDLLPGWRDAGRQIDDRVGEHLARRCEQLGCPGVALKVFGDYSQYRVNMTLRAARQLLHSLHVKHSIEQTIAAAALYSVYSLPPVAQDLPSCSMLVSACLKHRSKDSMQVANVMLPHLRSLLERTEPMKVDRQSVGLAQDRSSLWVQWTLKKIDKALYVRNGGRVEGWLRSWMENSGLVTAVSS